MVRRPLLLALVLLVAGCGDDGHDHDHHDDDMGDRTSMDASHDDDGHTDSGEHTEDCGEPGDTYTAGMTHAGTDGVFDFELVESVPGPPAKHDNTWTVRITDDTGAAVTGADVKAVPFMTEHGHGSNPPDFAATEGEDGTYEVTVDLFMGGLWEVTIEAATGDTSDAGVFTFCIAP